jgi:hypothetical protein
MAISYHETKASYHFTASDDNFLTTFVSAHARTWMSLMLVLSDAAGLLLAGILALELRSLFGLFHFGLTGYVHFAPLVLVFVAVFTVRDLYPAIGLSAVEQLRRLVNNTTLVFLAIAAFAFLDQTPPVYSRYICNLN